MGFHLGDLGNSKTSNLGFYFRQWFGMFGDSYMDHIYNVE